MHVYKRSEYTFEDKVAIVNFIIKNKGYTSLRGNSLWQDIERQKILNRSWQSVKEHFRKKIINMISIFDIPEEEKRLIKEGWESSRVIREGPNGKRIKRSRFKLHNDVGNEHTESKENYNVSDDSSSSSDGQQSSTQKTTKKRTSSKVKRPRSPSEFNMFSDEENVDVPKKTQIVNDVSSNNLENKSGSLTPDIIERVEVTNKPSSSNIQKSNNNKAVEDISDNIAVLSDSNVQEANKIKFIEINSDSDDVTIIASSNVKSNTTNSQQIPEFSLEEDMLLLNFIRSDKDCLRNMNDINVYRYFYEVHSHTRSPEILQKRFLNDIFPNIYKYNELTHEDMCSIYRIAGVDMPDNLKKLLANSNASNQNNTETQICDDLLDKIDCMYCHVVLNNEPHIFVSISNEIHYSNENVSNLLAKKFKIHPNNIYFTNFNSFFILKQINEFRKVIYEKYGQIITKSIQNKYKNINVEDIISNLEICIKSFDANEDDIGSESSSSELSLNKCESSQEEIINTQDFNPNQKSTPQKQVNEKPKIKEVLSSDDSSSICANDHSYNKQISQTNDKCTQEQNYDKEILQTDTSNTENFSQPCSSSSSHNISYKKFTRKKNNSQYLDSVSSQESISMRDSVKKIVTNVDLHNLSEIPSSAETFHTANYFSQ